jgi:hypothetical protein
MKIKWKVSDIPTGRYRSFEKRAWPHAYYNDKNESPMAMILCEDAYIPSEIKEGNHALLDLYVADHSIKPWKWRKTVRQFKTLKEAKAGLLRILKSNPELVPEEIRERENK